jgi:ribosomal protein L7/L12
MGSKNRLSSMKELLSLLEELFEKVRKPVVPPYPYDEQTNTITLPAEIEKELRQLVLNGNKPEAVKRVTQLTGAGLRVSKDYVDSLATVQHRRHRPSHPRGKRRK